MAGQITRNKKGAGRFKVPATYPDGWRGMQLRKQFENTMLNDSQRHYCKKHDLKFSELTIRCPLCRKETNI